MAITLPLPLPPQTQALTSTTFKPPPLDGSLTIPEIYDWIFHNTPNHPAFIFADGPNSTRTILWSEAVRAIHRAGRIILSRLKSDSESPKVLSARPVIAILASADSITYFTVTMGIARAGFVAFLISTRNSPAAIAHLLSATNPTHVLVGIEQSLQTLLTASLDLMDDPKVVKPTTSFLPEFEDLYFDQDESTFVPLPFDRPGLDEPFVTIHSSGSTGFPKIRHWTHHLTLQYACGPFYGERDLTGLRFGVHAVPIYHAMGILIVVFATTSGMTLATFKPQSPAIVATPESLLKNVVCTKSDFVYCVPSFVEVWANNVEDIASLQKTQGIITGGGPLNKEIGDRLIEAGVKIHVVYGSTEASSITPFIASKFFSAPSTIIPDVCPAENPGADWEYIRFNENVKVGLELDDRGYADLIVYPHPRHSPCVLNAKRGDVDVFETNDLFAPHPHKPGFWKVVGRTDDLIMHSTGEKTNPGPLECILNQNPHVLSSIIFGRGKLTAGVIVDPLPAYKFNPANMKALEDFRNTIWPSIERMNEYAPQHSRIFKEMILVAAPSKPFTYTAKNTPRRAAVIREYEPEIEALYAAVDETTQASIPPPTSWDLAESLSFVRVVVEKVLRHHIEDSDDLFQQGCDSLQVVWIRNSLLHALRSTTKINTNAIPSNFVYQNPTISSLAQYIARISLASGQGQGPCHDVDYKVQEMLEMVERHAQGFPKHSGSTAPPSKDVILVTGTTGSLGTTLLAHLVASDDVLRIFAVNRKADGSSLLERQMTSMRHQGLDPGIASSKKVMLLEADLNKVAFGLPTSMYEAMREQVTHIIHNAWRVDFNIALQSFEPQVKGLRNMIDFALSSLQSTPPRLLFMSSIGVLAHLETSPPALESPIEPSLAVSTGYTQSKWVSERLLECATAQTPLKPIIVRLGQVCGGGPNGHWNVKEWLPSLVRSSLYLGCLPNGEQAVTWISLDVVAKVTAEMRTSPHQHLHLVHPRPVSWSAISTAFSTALNLPLVPYPEWLTILEKSAVAANVNGNAPNGKSDFNITRDANPALTILDFFREMTLEADTATAFAVSVDKAKEASATLRDKNLAQLGPGDVEKWLSYWRSVGFFPAVGQ